jgi:hypothetical protein
MNLDFNSQNWSQRRLRYIGLSQRTNIIMFCPMTVTYKFQVKTLPGLSPPGDVFLDRRQAIGIKIHVFWWRDSSLLAKVMHVKATRRLVRRSIAAIRPWVTVAVRVKTLDTNIYLFIYFYFGYLYSAYPRVSSKRFTFTHTTGCATWVTLESRLHNSGAHDQSLPVSFSRASFSSHIFLHSYFTYFLPAFFHLSI